MKNVFCLLILNLLLSSYGLYAQKQELFRETSFTDEVLHDGTLKSYKSLQIDYSILQKLYAQAPEILNLSIPGLDGSPLSLSMQKRTILHEKFKVETASGDEANIKPGIHYAGVLIGDENSVVALSIFENSLFGLIATDAGNINLVFLKDENNNPSDRYVLYNDRDLTIANTFHCGAENLYSEKETIAEAQNSKAEGAVCRQIRQYWECDYQMFLDNGSSVQNTVNWTSAMFNVMAYIYHNEQVNMQISEIYVWDLDDPYTDDAGDALTEFGDARQNNFNGDLAHFITTLNSGNGGLAWVDVLCAQYSPNSSYGPYAYSNIDETFRNLPLWSWTINVVTHETGHNLGSKHTQWCGWELSPNVFGAIDSCYQTEEYNGSTCYNGSNIGRTGTVMSYCHLTGNVNLNLGFGPLPGNKIRERVAAASCITSYVGPTAPILSGQTQYCVGEDIQLYASSAGNILSWKGPNGFDTTANEVFIQSAIIAEAGMYVASVSNGLCTASSFLNVQVSSKPSTPYISQTGSTLKSLPTSTTYTYEWFDENGNLVATGQFFTPTSSGTYYTIVSRNGCASNQSAPFYYELVGASIDDVSFSGSKIWPNPATNYVYVSFGEEKNTEAKIILFDISGKNLYNFSLSGTSPYRLDLTGLAKGSYFLEMTQQTKRKIIKLIIQ